MSTVTELRDSWTPEHALAIRNVPELKVTEKRPATATVRVQKYPLCNAFTGA